MNNPWRNLPTQLQTISSSILFRLGILDVSKFRQTSIPKNLHFLPGIIQMNNKVGVSTRFHIPIRYVLCILYENYYDLIAVF